MAEVAEVTEVAEVAEVAGVPRCRGAEVPGCRNVKREM
jgi:hypothetical protein